ncbi:uncharacterized protein [Amphiura filiformis]|uniref:uncharacterized protein n=1 Tax=Amphiura filiformis TaxID=82378 RepID=UPI003B20F916
MARRRVQMAPLHYYLLVAIISGYSCVAQRFILQPSDTVYKVGESALLTCGLSGSIGTGTHHWIKGDPGSQTYVSRDLSIYDANVDATRYAVTKEGSVYTLRISSVKSADAGTYFCAIYNGEWINSNRASLEIITKWPRPTCTTDPQKATIGGTVSFLCALPPSTTLRLPLTWTYTAADFGGTKVMKPGETFSVDWTMRDTDNFGYFTCYAGRTTGHGGACVDTPLKIPPKPVVRPVNRKKLVGENAEFDCVPDIVHPNVTLYTWFVQGRDGYHEYTQTVGRFRVRQGGKNLKIRNLTLSDDNMEIWCKAQNNLGINAESDVKAHIYVQQGPETTTKIELPSTKAPTTSTNTDITTTITPANQTSNSNIIYNPEDSSNVKGIIVAGTIAGAILLIIIIILALYLLKGKDNNKSVIPVSVEPKKDNTNRYSKIIMRPLSVFMDRRDSQVTPTSEEGADVLYSLPLQKGGGTMRVKPLKYDLNNEDKEPAKIAQISPTVVSYKKTRNATLPVGVRGPAALRSDSKSSASPLRTKSLSASVVSLDSSGNADSDYVLYSLSSKRGGGTMKVKSRNASMDNLDSISQQSRSNSRFNLANMKPIEGQMGDSTYADVAFDSSNDLSSPNSRDSGQYSEYANVHMNSGSTYDLNSDLNRDSNYANVHIGPEESTYADEGAGDYLPPDSPYVNMTANQKITSESEYVEADFASVGSFSFDSSFDDDLDDDPQDLNKEGLVYARVDVGLDEKQQTKQIIGNKNKTVYADITKLL